MFQISTAINVSGGNLFIDACLGNAEGVIKEDRMLSGEAGYYKRL